MRFQYCDFGLSDNCAMKLTGPHKDVIIKDEADPAARYYGKKYAICEPCYQELLEIIEEQHGKIEGNIADAVTIIDF